MAKWLDFDFFLMEYHLLFFKNKMTQKKTFPHIYKGTVISKFYL